MMVSWEDVVMVMMLVSGQEYQGLGNTKGKIVWGSKSSSTVLGNTEEVIKGSKSRTGELEMVW